MATPGAGSSGGGGRFGSTNPLPSARCAVVQRDVQRALRNASHDTGTDDGCSELRPGFKNVSMMRDGAGKGLVVAR